MASSPGCSTALACGTASSSACYFGVFLGPLANDDALVITAADSEHSSHGCQVVKWSYFGDAFFNTALRHTADLSGLLMKRA
jgi:hypothetical protein